MERRELTSRKLTSCDGNLLGFDHNRVRNRIVRSATMSILEPEPPRDPDWRDYITLGIIIIFAVACIVVIAVNIYLGIKCGCFDKEGWPR